MDQIFENPITIK